jgi:hypothetical protein
MKYELKSNGSSKIGAALATLCSQGKAGETLVLNGVSQGAVSLFGATLAARMIAQGKSTPEIAEVFDLASIANASALKQALEDLEIVLLTEEGKPLDDADFAANGGKFLQDGKRVQMLVSHYWATKGKGKATVNLAALKDL